VLAQPIPPSAFQSRKRRQACGSLPRARRGLLAGRAPAPKKTRRRRGAGRTRSPRATRRRLRFRRDAPRSSGRKPRPAKEVAGVVATNRGAGRDADHHRARVGGRGPSANGADRCGELAPGRLSCPVVIGRRAGAAVAMATTRLLLAAGLRPLLAGVAPRTACGASLRAGDSSSSATRRRRLLRPLAARLRVAAAWLAGESRMPLRRFLL